MSKLLSLDGLKVSVDDKQILNGIDFDLNSGEVHAIMGPNGSGKSTLSYTLMGHPKYKILAGKMFFDGQELSELSVDQRAKKGLFLAFQYPHEIEGASVKSFLRQSYNSIYSGTEKDLSFKEFNELLSEKMDLLKIKPEFIQRGINVGFSGGEKKRLEVLQLAVLQPKLAILDEIDSGLDVDALKVVCDGINNVKRSNPDMSLLIITHYARILHFLEPNFVHVMKEGKIIKSGNKQLAEEIEVKGYK